MPTGIYERMPEHREKLRNTFLQLWAEPTFRERRRKGMARPDVREKMRQAGRNRKLSPETKEKIRRANLGKELSPSTRDKIRKAMVGNKHTLGKKNGLGYKHSAGAKGKIRQAVLGSKRSPETREKMRQARLRRTLPTKMTSIERLLRGEFKKRRLKFEMHKTMFRRFQPDFVFEQARLIVQADGDYWHGLPKGKRRDAAFAQAASADGWTVWRFGEQQIHMHADSCARAVARFVTRRPR